MMNRKAAIVLGVTSCTALAGAFIFPQVFATRYVEPGSVEEKVAFHKKESKEETVVALPEVDHVETPKAVKAIYMSSWVGSTVTKRAGLIKLIKDTELNAV